MSMIDEVVEATSILHEEIRSSLSCYQGSASDLLNDIESAIDDYNYDVGLVMELRQLSEEDFEELREKYGADAGELDEIVSELKRLESTYLIPDDEINTYIQQELEEVGDIPSWLENYIDWESIVSDSRSGYSNIVLEINGFNFDFWYK